MIFTGCSKLSSSNQLDEIWTIFFNFCKCRSVTNTVLDRKHSEFLESVCLE